MNYSVIINAFLSENMINIRNDLQHFLKQSNLAPENGTAIVFLSSFEEIEHILSYVPVANVVAVRIIYPDIEQVLELLSKQLSNYIEPLCFFANDAFGRPLAVRLAYKNHAQSLTSVQKIKIDSNCIKAWKYIYANQVEATFCCQKKFYFTYPVLETSNFFPDVIEQKILTKYDFLSHTNPSIYNELTIEQKKIENSLETASFVIVIGRGIGNQKNLSLVRDASFKFGAEWGVTRAVMMNGWAPIDRVIGASGRTLNAELCLVLGASGASAFMFGLSQCKKIIAVNTDKDAPVFQGSDVGIIGNCMTVFEKIHMILGK